MTRKLIFYLVFILVAIALISFVKGEENEQNMTAGTSVSIPVSVTVQ